MPRQGIGLQTSVGERPHRIRLYNPPAAVPDTDGSYTLTGVPLSPPAVYARIAPASSGDLERIAAGSVVSHATHVINMPFHPQLRTATTIEFDVPGRTRTFAVIGFGNPDERGIEHLVFATEVLP
jgi:hypothetical protein